MKSWIKIILFIIITIVFLIIVDIVCIFMLHKPLFAIQGIEPYSYNGVLYDVYYCPEYSTPQIHFKGSKFKCSVNSSSMKVVKIDDTTKYIDDFVCAEMLEEFYSDEKYHYYFSCVKNEYIIAQYEDGSTEPVSDALKKGNIKISDLDLYNISYYKYNIND